jgi:SAM-dependent methyltransferase
VNIEPPDLSAPRFDPVFVTEDDLEDLSTFTGKTKDSCLARLREYSPHELADEWRRLSPQTPEAIMSFYASTELYIWELMQWHASQARFPYWATLISFVERFPPTGWLSLYDFGCGVGTDGLFLAGRGYDVTLVDVDGPTLEFARHRARRRGIDARFLVSSSITPQPDRVFDAIVCFDVFEHLTEPVAAARSLVNHLRPGGVLVQQGTFHDAGHSPCHLHEHIEDFGGHRWYAQLAALGMKGLGGMLFQKQTGAARLLQRARYVGWRATGLWLVDARKGH